MHMSRSCIAIKTFTWPQLKKMQEKEDGSLLLVLLQATSGQGARKISTRRIDLSVYISGDIATPNMSGIYSSSDSGTLATQDDTGKTDRNVLLDGLRVVPVNTFVRPVCLPNTRTHIVREVEMRLVNPPFRQGL